MRAGYLYTFGPNIPAQEIEAVLVLAALATAGLHPDEAVPVETRPAVDAAVNVVVLSADTPAGRDLNRVFLALATRGFGPNGFGVTRVGEGNEAGLAAAT